MPSARTVLKGSVSRGFTDGDGGGSATNPSRMAIPPPAHARMGRTRQLYSVFGSMNFVPLAAWKSVTRDQALERSYATIAPPTATTA